ncbi:hypothetical protein [Curtobacterium sp. Leaf261]|uniref:hypothetical protein n=1 Tax=Curtobacterium sp. Leaf261 TaxID=1736311 RepID=UPI0006F454DD|nr:hypothetical protein [Curtobacterium sp. Leaf261]KQO63060.1 hypothetical protein ASF23_09310 [Curtobacterium sp. Leaf261]
MIDWSAFLLVAVVAVVSACFVVFVYSVGLRLWSAADAMAGKYSIRADGTLGPSTSDIPGATSSVGMVRLVRSGAIACYVVCALVVLYGIYLIVPQFH